MTKREFLDSCNILSNKEDIEIFFEKVSYMYDPSMWNVYVYAGIYFLWDDGGTYRLHLDSREYEGPKEEMESFLWEYASRQINS
jgi:hypothetical protein